MNITPHPFKSGDLIRYVSRHKTPAIVLKTLPKRRIRIVWMDNMEIDEGDASRFVLIQSATNIGQPPGRPVNPQVYQRLASDSEQYVNTHTSVDDISANSCN